MLMIHNDGMNWTVIFHEEFDREFMQFAMALQDELLAHAKLLSKFGPNLDARQWIR